MKNKKIGSILCLSLGILLLVVAAVFLILTVTTTENTRQKAAQILEKVEGYLPQIVDRVPEERGNNQMSAIEVDGLNVTAILEFPQYQRRLAVLSGWDAQKVGAIPCRFTGSIYDDSLIIGSSDARGQLDFASRLEVGQKLSLTDMEGNRYTYAVTAIQHTDHATLEKLQSGDQDLTIFLKDSQTGKYLLIRCETAFGTGNPSSAK